MFVEYAWRIPLMNCAAVSFWRECRRVLCFWLKCKITRPLKYQMLRYISLIKYWKHIYWIIVCIRVLLRLSLLFQSLKAHGLFMNIRYVLPWMWEMFVRKMNMWQQQILWTSWKRCELLSFSEITEIQPLAGHRWKYVKYFCTSSYPFSKCALPIRRMYHSV